MANEDKWLRPQARALTCSGKTSLEPHKVKAARAIVARAGLAQFGDIREGDAMKTLATLESPIDFLFLDGWKNLYLPIVKLLSPKMRAGAVVLADNIFTFKKTLRPYVAHMQDRANGFESVTVRLGHGMEYAVRPAGSQTLNRGHETG